MSPETTEAQSWGRHSLTFTLPMVDLQLRGLSAEQQECLSRSYPDFIRAVDTNTKFSGPACRAYRLPRAPDIPVDMLTLDGQYAPRKLKQDETIELTGINFQARIDVGNGGEGSTLGVANEHELPLCNVIENFLRVYVAHHALRRGGVILHSAGLVLDDRAYVFVGRSNAGKTTLTRKAYRCGARVVSDDINLVLPDRDSYRVYAVPFTGEFGRTLHQPGCGNSYPIAGIMLLQQDERLKVRPVRESEAMAKLLVGCPFVNTGTDESKPLFDVLSDLVRNVPVLNLSFSLGHSFTDIMYAVTESIDNA